MTPLRSVYGECVQRLFLPSRHKRDQQPDGIRAHLSRSIAWRPGRGRVAAACSPPRPPSPVAAPPASPTAHRRCSAATAGLRATQSRQHSCTSVTNAQDKQQCQGARTRLRAKELLWKRLATEPVESPRDRLAVAHPAAVLRPNTALRVLTTLSCCRKTKSVGPTGEFQSAR